MFRLKDVFYYEEDILTKEKIQRLIKQFSPNSKNREDIFEFLYLQGNERGWNWGRVGSVNAALLYKSAREYFKKFF